MLKNKIPYLKYKKINKNHLLKMQGPKKSPASSRTFSEYKPKYNFREKRISLR